MIFIKRFFNWIRTRLTPKPKYVWVTVSFRKVPKGSFFRFVGASRLYKKISKQKAISYDTNQKGTVSRFGIQVRPAVKVEVPIELP